MAYEMWVGQRERQYLADRQAFGVAALTHGDTNAAPPSWDERQADFDRWLTSDGRAQSDVLAMLGLAA